jgi:hypothetical protein
MSGGSFFAKVAGDCSTDMMVGDDPSTALFITSFTCRLSSWSYVELFDWYITGFEASSATPAKLGIKLPISGNEELM